MRCNCCHVALVDDVAQRNHYPCRTCAWCYLPVAEGFVRVGCQKFCPTCYPEWEKARRAADRKAQRLAA